MNAPGNATLAFTITPGTSTTKSVLFIFRLPTGATRAFYTTDIARGEVTTTVGTDWLNGAYELISVTVTDAWDRTLIYTADGKAATSYTPNDDTLALIATWPKTHSFTFSNLNFTVAGGVSTVNPPRLNELSLTAGGTLSPGGVARYKYTFTPGTSAVARLRAIFRYGAFPVGTKIVTVDNPPATGSIDFAVTSDLLNGPVFFDELQLIDAQSRTTFYSRLSPQVRDLDYADSMLAAPSPIGFSALGFTISGVMSTFYPPTIAISSSSSSASPGRTVRFTYAIDPGSFPVRGLSVVLAGPFGTALTITTNAPSGTFDVPIQADWITGTYWISEAYAVGAQRPSFGMTVPASGAAFTVTGAISFPPVITKQPTATQTVVQGRSVILSVETIGAAPISVQWYRGARGNVSTPLPEGTSNVLDITATENASYWARVTSAGLSTDSAEANVIVIKKPIITAGPSNQSAAVGGSATFSVTATSVAPLTYRWRVGPRELTDGVFNQATITLNNLTASDAGLVSCNVSNAAGEAYSATAILNIRVSTAPLTITLNPQDAVTAPGTGPTVIFNAAATGNPPLLYQWQKDGVDLPYENGTMLVIRTYGIPADAPGAYRLKVTNGAETVYSRAAVLSFAHAPVILRVSGSGDPNATLGNYVEFYPSVIGDAPFTYQWRKNGQPIPGATAESLRLGPLTFAHAGSYDVVVSNAAGSAISAASVVTVSEAITPPEILRGPVSQTVATGQSVTFTVTATGANLRYEWRKDSLIIPGATNASYTIAAASATDAGSYDVFVSNQQGSRGVPPVMLTVISAIAAPTITRQPVAQVLRSGDTLILTAAADGAGPLQLQWLFNGEPLVNRENILGANTDTLRVLNFTPANAGTFALRVTNSAGTVTTTAVSASVAPPSNSARIVNLSVRAAIGADTGPLIVGFVVGGARTTGVIPLLVRGAGPALENYGVADALPDPQFKIYADGNVWEINDDWLGNASVSSTGARLGAFPFASPQSRDAALVQNFWTRDFSVHVIDARNRSGTTLAEVYDASTADTVTELTPRLINISARNRVTPGQPLIAGFVIRGSGTRTVLVRGIGPALAAFGVNDAISAAQLAVFNDRQVSIAENGGWAGTPALAAAFTQVGAFSLSPVSKDAALLITLDPGSYTAQVSDANAGTGTALVEVYEVPPSGQ